MPPPVVLVHNVFLVSRTDIMETVGMSECDNVERRLSQCHTVAFHCDVVVGGGQKQATLPERRAVYL